MKIIARTTTFFLLLLLCSGVVLAKTPDGQPPSEETVCDVLREPGITPGLFGLCNAYCEAQDCHLYSEADRPRSCERLLHNYNRKKTDSDPDMPCADAICPCLAGVDLEDLEGETECDGNTASFENGAELNVNPEGCIFTAPDGQVTSVSPLSPDEEDLCLAFLAENCPD